MKPVYRYSAVTARCPDCGAVTTFESARGGSEFGVVVQQGDHRVGYVTYSRIGYRLLQCANCGRGGLAKVHFNDSIAAGVLGEFFPISVERAELPKGIPDGIVAEYREGERCAAVGAWRAASAMFRSTLEKTLKANGYTGGTLEAKINEAGAEGVITAALQQAAHDDVRLLGNDVLHDDWREVTPDEVADSHRYVQRILEAFYDQRPTVEKILVARGRLTPPATTVVP